MSKKSRQTVEQIGKKCAYCPRIMSFNHKDNHPTRDHTIPRAALRKMPEAERQRASVVVWCCELCNTIRGDLSAKDWQLYRQRFPDWSSRGRMIGIHRRHAFQRGEVRVVHRDPERLSSVFAEALAGRLSPANDDAG